MTLAEGSARGASTQVDHTRHARLLYHNIRAIPYPTNSSSNLLAIRFAAPVRIASLRITPEGVESIDGIGVTYPTRWTGKVYFNLSNASPVNVLSSTELHLEESDWALDYPIDMPEGVTTRLILLESPAERLSISVYGWSATDTVDSQIVDGSSFDPALSQDVSTDLSWLYQWAGDTDALIALLSTSPATAGKAIECLDVLTTMDPTIPSRISRNQSAVGRISSSTSDAARRLYTMTAGPADIRARYGAPKDLLEVVEGEESNLARLLRLAEEYANRSDTEAKLSLDAILDLLPESPSDPILSYHLASAVPRLCVISQIHGSDRQMSFPPNLVRAVLRSLKQISNEIIDGKSCWQTARRLAEPYLSSLAPTDPLRAAFELPKPESLDVEFRGMADADTLNDRRLHRLGTALADAHPSLDAPPSGVIHLASPAQLIQLIAPHLYASLQTSAVPPLGISAKAPSAEALAQASAFAGKVYNMHEFRREREGGGGGGSGLGIGAGAVGRPASRHVDDFGMASA